MLTDIHSRVPKCFIIHRHGEIDVSFEHDRRRDASADVMSHHFAGHSKDVKVAKDGTVLGQAWPGPVQLFSAEHHDVISGSVQRLEGKYWQCDSNETFRM